MRADSTASPACDGPQYEGSTQIAGDSPAQPPSGPAPAPVSGIILVVTDLSPTAAIEMAAHLQARHPNTRILLLSDCGGANSATAALDQRPRPDAPHAVPQHSAAGDRPAADESRARTQTLGLSERELDVWRLVAQGLKNREIGRTLSISERTVEHHIASLSSKLGACSRVEVAVLAVQVGLV